MACLTASALICTIESSQLHHLPHRLSALLTYFRAIHTISPAHQAVLSMSCLMAFALNYTIFLNTSINSALTQTMCGNIKDLGTVGIGWALFGGLPFDLVRVARGRVGKGMKGGDFGGVFGG
ncbi:unnamed protein product [Closterium sp. Yama58-4]|nr:unnamed protein product [Closterium sp. Yama58-4]